METHLHMMKKQDNTTTGLIKKIINKLFLDTLITNYLS